MSTAVSQIAPRLIAAVQDSPAALMTGAARELARRWNDCERGIDADAASDLAEIRDTIAILAGLLGHEGAITEWAAYREEDGDLPAGIAGKLPGHELTLAARDLETFTA